MEQPKGPSGKQKANKNHLIKDEVGRTEWVQKKPRPVNESRGTSANSHSKSKPKKGKKVEERRRNEEGASIAEEVALHVLLGENSDDEDDSVGLKKDGNRKFDLLKCSLEELGWDCDADDGHWPTWSNLESYDWDVSSDDRLVRDSQPQFFEAEAEVTDTRSEEKSNVSRRLMSHQQRGGNHRSRKMSNGQRNATNHMNDRQFHDRKKRGEQLRAYFRKMFSSDNPDPASELEELINPAITGEENEALCSIPTAVEIKQVLNKMESRKLPGPDGRPASVYQAHWDDTIGQALVETVQGFFNTGYLPKEMNVAYLIFVPKYNNKSGLFVEVSRTLTICNAAYKVISRIMSNRLRPLLDKIISPFQSAFVPNRSISDEATIVNEMIDYMHKRKKGKKGYMALKLKMENAYHLTEWPFLFEVMRRHGFSDKWLLLVKQCVSTASLTILIDRVTYGNVRLKRGLREGDPISHSLFIIAADVLSRMIIREEHNRAWHGIKVSRTSPYISHLMNREKLILFCRADLADAECLRAQLRKYSEWSGHIVDFEKSSIYVSKNINNEDAKQFKEAINIFKFCAKAKNWGRPSQKSVLKNEAFDEVVKKLATRLSSWKAESLPWMGVNGSLECEMESEASNGDADDIGSSDFVANASLVKRDNDTESDEGESSDVAPSDFVSCASLVEGDNEAAAYKIDNSGFVANTCLVEDDNEAEVGKGEACKIDNSGFVINDNETEPRKEEAAEIDCCRFLAAASLVEDDVYEAEVGKVEVNKIDNSEFVANASLITSDGENRGLSPSFKQSPREGGVV